MKYKLVSTSLILLLLGNSGWAQQSQAESEDSNLRTSENWSKNWEESWRESLAERQSFWQKAMQWQVSDDTLVRIYGQINVGHLQYEDGFGKISTTRDNPNSPSRLGVRLDKDFENGGNLFLNLEVVPENWTVG